MRVTMMLADAAEVADGKLFVLGGGWKFIGPGPHPHAIVLLFDVPWDQTNRRVRWEVTLLDADGSPLAIGPEGEAPHFGGEFEAGRPAGMPAGSEVSVPFAINIPPLPLLPGSRYEWRLRVDGQGRHDWTLAFNTRPA